MEQFYNKVKEFLLSNKGSFSEEFTGEIPVLQMLPDTGDDGLGLTVHELQELKDTYDILNSYRMDKIVLVKVGPDFKKNQYAMKKAIESFKMSCETRAGRIAGLDDNWLMLLPETVDVEN